MAGNERRDVMSSLLFSKDVQWSCSLCGTKGENGQTPACGCWVSCPCGWSYEKGTACRNPEHRQAKGRR